MNATPEVAGNPVLKALRQRRTKGFGFRIVGESLWFGRITARNSFEPLVEVKSHLQMRAWIHEAVRTGLVSDEEHHALCSHLGNFQFVDGAWQVGFSDEEPCTHIDIHDVDGEGATTVELLNVAAQSTERSIALRVSDLKGLFEPHNPFRHPRPGRGRRIRRH